MQKLRAIEDGGAPALTRRAFLEWSAAAAAASLARAPAAGVLAAEPVRRDAPAKEKHGKAARSMRFGLVTYQWGRDWDVPALIRNCEKARVLGVELRTTHAHRVEPSLNAAERREVKKRFADSEVTLVGLGSDERFDSPDSAKLARAIKATRAFIELSRDVGGSGVKVKPNSFHDGVPHEKTIEQIGRTLRSLGPFAADRGQEIRLEVHGQCSRLETIKAIMEIADHPSVAVCWNSNRTDLAGKGLEHNFDLVRKRLGKTLHVHDLRSKAYPYEKLLGLLVRHGYTGWVLLEASHRVKDRIAALADQRAVFERLVARCRARAR